MTLISEDVMSKKNDDHVSPYLRRPIRSLVEYLREAAQRRKHQGGQEEIAEKGSRPSDGVPSEGSDTSKDCN